MHRSGQSLVEVLIAIAVAAILFVGTASLITPSLTENKTTNQSQVGFNLAKEMINNIRLLSEGNWHTLYNLATSSANTYYILASSSPFSVATGTESISLSSTTYTRYFYVSDVYRDANGYVTSTVGTCLGSSPCYDPSTKQITIIFNWTRGVTTTLNTYLTRNRVNIYDQTDWSGGPGLNGPVTSTNAQFATSTNIGYASIPGSIISQGNSSDWPNGYVYRRTITASSSLIAPSGTTLTNFPVLISNTYSFLAASSSGGTLQSSNGYDIIFTSDASGTNTLNYERESYSSSTGAMNFWVNVPTFSATTNTIYMFYDNATVATDQSNATGTWNNNYAMVAHLGGGNFLNPADSTGNTTGANGGGGAAETPNGEIDGAANFVSTSSDFISYGVATATQITNNITMEGWFLSTTTPSVSNIGVLNQFLANPSGHYGTALGLDTGSGGAVTTGSVAMATGNGVVNEWEFASTTAVSDGLFHDYVGTFASGAYQIYLDGKRILNVTGSNTSTAYGGTSSLFLGRNQAGTGFFDGDADEIRISNVVRSSDWIKTEYNNESSPSNFYGIGAATLYGGATTGLISTSTSQHWAWNDSLGWIDFYNSNNVGVGSSGLTGYASSSVGDISLDCNTTRKGNICATSTYQVLNDGSGDLSGWAWNDSLGWISFCGGQASANCPGSVFYQTTIDSGGNFQGWAWNDSVGWIDFNCDNNASCGTSNFEVKTNWVAPTATSTGQLDSSTFDTGDAQGAQYNSIMWLGSLTSGSTVQFQFATSNSSSGPWNFTGPDGTSNTYYSSSGPGGSTPFSYTAFNNFRYFRYRIFIPYTNGTSSRVDDVIVNWSP